MWSVRLASSSSFRDKPCSRESPSAIERENMRVDLFRDHEQMLSASLSEAQHRSCLTLPLSLSLLDLITPVQCWRWARRRMLVTQACWRSFSVLEEKKKKKKEEEENNPSSFFSFLLSFSLSALLYGCCSFLLIRRLVDEGPLDRPNGCLSSHCFHSVKINKSTSSRVLSSLHLPTIRLSSRLVRVRVKESPERHLVRVAWREHPWSPL